MGSVCLKSLQEHLQEALQNTCANKRDLHEGSHVSTSHYVNLMSHLKLRQSLTQYCTSPYACLTPLRHSQSGQ